MGLWYIYLCLNWWTFTTCSAQTTAPMSQIVVDLGRQYGIDTLILTVCREWGSCKTFQLFTVAQKMSDVF